MGASVRTRLGTAGTAASFVLLLLVGVAGPNAARPGLGPRGWAPGDLGWHLTSAVVTGLLWAAYVVVRNTGDLPHRPPASYLPDLRDSAGMSHAATPVADRRGRSLDPRTVLRPGAAVEGYVVWSLPRGTSPATVVLRGAAHTVRWEPGTP